MAILLWVENAEPFELNRILPKIGESLSFILGLPHTPDLVGTEVWKPEKILADSCYFDWDADHIGIKVCGEAALVSVSPASDREAICVSPDYSRTELEYALAAAVVIAIGEHSQGQIYDHALAYTRKPALTPKEFTEYVKVNGVFENINEAAVVFFSRLPMSPS